MAYFSHAFRKTFIIADDFLVAGDTSTINPGQGGFYDAKTWNAVPLAEASIAQHPQVVFATGFYRATTGDKVGNHGGYTESFKSPVIDPLHVHRFWKVAGNAVQAHIVQVGWDGTNAGTAPKFYCGQNYHLRVDIKGSPVLRLVDHNVYHIFDVKTACCADDTPELVDPVAVLLNIARQINESPIVSKFITASVRNGGGTVNPDTYVTLTDPTDIANATAGLRLTAAYSDTRFNYFSFNPREHYELEPVIISSAQLIDDTGDPCSLFKQLTFTEVQAPKSAQGSGETVLREFVLDNEYRQDPFPWDVRKKDITDFSWLAISIANPLLHYDSYYILMSIPRKNNPSGMHDNDQYLLRICAQDASMLADFEDWFTAYLSSAGTGVALETIS